MVEETIKGHHVTDLLLAMQCEARYHWQVARRLRSPWDGVSKPVGTAVHRGLEALYRGAKRAVAADLAVGVYQAATPDELRRQLPGDELAKVEGGELQVKKILALYPWGPADFEAVEALEEPLRADLDGVTIVGTIDRIVRANGLRYIHDTKTSGLAMSLASRVQKLSLQYPAYTWLARKNGLDVQGVIVEMIHKPSTYLRKDKFFSIGNPEFFREPIVLTDYEIARWTDNAREALVRAERADSRMLTTSACLTYMRVCPYLDLCMNPLRAERLASELYVVAEER